MKTSVSIITINYNSLEDTLSFLDHLESGINSTDLDVEVIVVDNSSAQSPERNLKQYEWVKLVQSKFNLGFAGGNNLGILESRGDYLFIVNNDTLLNLKDLEELISQYKSNPEYGILNPVIKNEDHTIQFAGYTAINALTGRNRLINKVNSSQGIAQSNYPHGAAMLISREALDKVGLMSENYFLYYEELDWGNRLSKLNMKIGVCLSSEIIHKESATIGKISECKLYFMTRNRILFARKHFTRIERTAFAAFFLLVSFPKNVFLFLIKNDLGSVRTYLEAIKWHFRNDCASTKLGYKFDQILKRA